MCIVINIEKEKKKQFKILAKFLSVFVTDTKIIFGYNFETPLKMRKQLKKSCHENTMNINRLNNLISVEFGSYRKCCITFLFRRYKVQDARLLSTLFKICSDLFILKTTFYKKEI